MTAEVPIQIHLNHGHNKPQPSAPQVILQLAQCMGTMPGESIPPPPDYNDDVQFHGQGKAPPDYDDDTQEWVEPLPRLQQQESQGGAKLNVLVQTKRTLHWFTTNMTMSCGFCILWIQSMFIDFRISHGRPFSKFDKRTTKHQLIHINNCELNDG